MSRYVRLDRIIWAWEKSYATVTLGRSARSPSPQVDRPFFPTLSRAVTGKARILWVMDAVPLRMTYRHYPRANRTSLQAGLGLWFQFRSLTDPGDGTVTHDPFPFIESAWSDKPTISFVLQIAPFPTPGFHCASLAEPATDTELSSQEGPFAVQLGPQAE